jgi:hypothetical protein
MSPVLDILDMYISLFHYRILLGFFIYFFLHVHVYIRVFGTHMNTSVIYSIVYRASF